MRSMGNSVKTSNMVIMTLKAAINPNWLISDALAKASGKKLKKVVMAPEKIPLPVVPAVLKRAFRLSWDWDSSILNRFKKWMA